MSKLTPEQISEIRASVEKVNLPGPLTDRSDGFYTGWATATDGERNVRVYMCLCESCSGIKDLDGKHALRRHVLTAVNSIPALLSHISAVEAERDAAQAEAEKLRAAITHAMDYANGRWDEWGQRAVATCDILESALTPPAQGAQT